MKKIESFLTILLPLFLFGFGKGCLPHEPNANDIQLFVHNLKEIVKKKDSQQLYKLLSFSLQKRFQKTLSTLQREIQKHPQKTKPVLEKFGVSYSEILQWKLPDYLKYMFQKSEFNDFQDFSIQQMKIRRIQWNYKAQIILQKVKKYIQEKRTSQDILLDLLWEGGEWKINNLQYGKAHKLSNPLKNIRSK